MEVRRSSCRAFVEHAIAYLYLCRFPFRRQILSLDAAKMPPCWRLTKPALPSVYLASECMMLSWQIHVVITMRSSVSKKMLLILLQPAFPAAMCRLGVLHIPHPRSFTGSRASGEVRQNVCLMCCSFDLPLRSERLKVLTPWIIELQLSRMPSYRQYRPELAH